MRSQDSFCERDRSHAVEGEDSIHAGLGEYMNRRPVDDHLLNFSRITGSSNYAPAPSVMEWPFSHKQRQAPPSLPVLELVLESRHCPRSSRAGDANDIDQSDNQNSFFPGTLPDDSSYSFPDPSDAESMVIPQESRRNLIMEALRLANVSDTTANIRAVEIIVEHESHWDANAINDWDRNAKIGQHTRGLMQVRPDTFEENAIDGYRNIHDPISNMVAAIRYAVDRYDSLSNVPGVRAVRRGHRYRGY